MRPSPGGRSRAPSASTARARRTAEPASADPRHGQLHAPMERLAIHDVDQHEADQPPERESGDEADAADRSRPSLASIAPICRRVIPMWRSMPNSRRRDRTQRAERRRQAEQADDDRGELERVGDGEGAIEGLERELADFARRGDLELCAPPGTSRAIARLSSSGFASGREPERAVGGACDRR